MKKYALGIDLGGTGTKFGLVNEDGQVLRSNSIPTQQYPDIDEYCDVLCDGLKRLVADEGLELSDIVGIGCGAPNANFYSGCIEQAPNLPWKGVVPFAKLISERMGVKCTITNDANAAAQGEMIYGSARGMKTVSCSTDTTVLPVSWVTARSIIAETDVSAVVVKRAVLRLMLRLQAWHVRPKRLLLLPPSRPYCAKLQTSITSLPKMCLMPPRRVTW